MNQKIVIVMMVILVISCLHVGAGRGKAVKKRNRRNTLYPQEVDRHGEESKLARELMMLFFALHRMLSGDVDDVKLYHQFKQHHANDEDATFPYDARDEDATFPYDARDEDATFPYDARDEDAKRFHRLF